MYYKFSLLFLTIICLFGCSSHNDISHLESNVKIKIGYPVQENFNTRYKNNVINQQFPNLNYTIIPLYDKINEGMSSEELVANTDIIYVSNDKMSEFIDAGLLKNLDPLIKKSTLDLSKFHPEVIEYIRNLGGGSLYGIPTSLRGLVLAYNKDVFDAYQIEYPHDGMSWEHILYTAQLFPQNGLVISGIDPIEIIYEIGHYRGLQAYNKDFNIVNIANENWEDVWEELITPIRNGAISFDRNDFFNHHAAMAIISDNSFHHIENDTNIDAVTMPIDPNNPTEAKYTYVDGFYALSENTSYVKESFELLEFFLTPQLSQLEKARKYHSISIYKSDPSLKSERALLHFKPSSKPYENLPSEFITYGKATIDQLLSNNELTLQDALSSMQLDIVEALGGSIEE